MEKKYQLTKGQISIIEFWSPMEKALNVDLVGRTMTRLVKAIGMTPHGDPRIITYDPLPLPPTVVQSLKLSKSEIEAGLCAIQPLTESYAVMDFWTEIYYKLALAGKIDANKIRPFAYGNLVINSCKQFEVAKAIGVLEDCLGAWKLKTNVPYYYDGVIE